MLPRAGLAKLELPETARVVVTVTGLEWLLRVKTRSSDVQSDIQKFFGYLQWTREGLREFQYPIMLWITSTILLEMSKKAPDFWSWRKAVLRFVSDAASPVLPVVREYPAAPAGEAIASERINYDDDFIPPPAEILSEISKLAARDPASPNLATLYAKLAEIYTRRIAKGEATDLEQEQQQAIEAFEEAIDRYRSINKKSALSITLKKFSNFLYGISRYMEAIDFHQQSLEIKREIGDRYGEANSLFNQAIVIAKYEPRRFESLSQLRQARTIFVELKLGHIIKQCDEAIYAFEQIISTEQRQSAPTICDPCPPEDWVKRSLAKNSTSRPTSPPKIHWTVWFCVGLGICSLLFLLRRK